MFIHVLDISEKLRESSKTSSRTLWTTFYW